MKKLFFLFLVSQFLLSCTKMADLSIENSLEIDRKNEMVSFCLCQVEKQLDMQEGDQIVILDPKHDRVPYQILSDGSTVIFQANVPAESTAHYHVLVGEPDSVEAKTFGRQVPERKDDFAWESDRIAFRMYGPALAPENPSNGVDIWLKRTDELIVDKFYKDDLEKGIHYHVDNGQGLDCYKVGHTLGAGGIAPYVDSTLWIGNHYSSYKVLENGPLRTVFELLYDSVTVTGKILKQRLTVTIDAGSQLNKAEVSYNIDNTMPVAAGIYLHDSIDNIKTDAQAGYIAYAENAVSDAGVASGRNYVGVIMYSDITATPIVDNTLLAVTEYNPEAKFQYFFGAGWSKWGFEKDEDWFAYMANMAKKIKHPLRIKVK